MIPTRCNQLKATDVKRHKVKLGQESVSAATGRQPDVQLVGEHILDWPAYSQHGDLTGHGEETSAAVPWVSRVSNVSKDAEYQSMHL